MGVRVLILEHDEALARELEDAFVERACEVVAVAAPEDAAALLPSQRFDVVVAALELCDFIKNELATTRVPLVLLSSTSSQGEFAKAAPRANVAGFFAKPFAVSDLVASLLDRRSTTSARPPSGDLRETIKNQERVVASLRADLTTRGQAIERLGAKAKELTERLAEAQALLDDERRAHAASVAALEAIKETHAAELADRERAHADEIAFVERAHEEATEAATRRREDSERFLAAERAAHIVETEARNVELAELRELALGLERERDAAIAQRDEARELAREAALDAAETRKNAESSVVARLQSLEAELAAATAKVTELARALDAAERETIQQQLARDAAFHDMNVRAAADLEAAVTAAKIEAAAERAELIRLHEHALKVTRDKAIAQTLAVARERKKQNS